MTDAERARMVDDLLQQAEWAYSDGKVRLQGLLLRAAEVISKESVAAARAEERERCAGIADRCASERRAQLPGVEAAHGNVAAVVGKLSEAERIAEAIRKETR